MSAETASFHDASDPSAHPSTWSFGDVEARLVEAMAVLYRLPDREAGWRKVQIMSLWRQVQREWGDYVDADQAPRQPGVTRREMAEMEEALGWLDWVPSGDTRRIVGMALHQLLSGVRKGHAVISWTAMHRRLAARGERGWTTDGLRKRYGRAIGTVCARLNGVSAGQIWSEPSRNASVSGCRGRQAVKSTSTQILGVRPTGGQGL